MMYVGVKHKPEHDNLFWFSVPDSISKHIKVGAQVLCDTKKGASFGVVVSIIEGVSQKKAAGVIGDYFPLKGVLAVKRDVDISDIHIPWEMRQSSPSPDKIALRIKELYDTCYFHTPVTCSADNNLQDGYTAYLVARMFGHETLSAFCVA